MITAVDGIPFNLVLDASDHPYVLRRLRRDGKRCHWAIVWASWHKGLPTGIRKRAIAQCGFEWRNDTPAILGWHRIPKESE